MSNWIKIQSFQRIHQAELCKSILEEHEIKSVIINEKDSLFLIGEIELYVEKNNEKIAKALIDEFRGLTKINSFIELKPVLLFQKILQENGIQTTLKRKQDSRYIADNYELYVKNIDVANTIPYLTGEKLKSWKPVFSCKKVRQAKLYNDLLDEAQINTIIIKKKNSDFHLEEINIYVHGSNFEKGNEIIQNLKGFETIRTSENYSNIEQQEETLAKEGIRALISNKDDKFNLLVLENKVQESNEILQKKSEWTIVKTFGNILNANMFKGVLENNEIPSVIINEKDSSFLLGEIELYVEKQNLDKAQEIIQSYKNSTIEE